MIELIAHLPSVLIQTVNAHPWLTAVLAVTTLGMTVGALWTRASLTHADRTARAELRAALVALDGMATRSPGRTISEYLDANSRVIDAEKALPWYKRVDIELRATY
jgi:hypothetical protein